MRLKLYVQLCHNRYKIEHSVFFVLLDWVFWVTYWNNFIYFGNFFRQQLHLGVLRDIEQQERRKIQNVFYLQQQRELTKTLQKAEKQTKDQLLEAV